MEITQLFLIITIFILGITLTLVGVQVFLVLRDFQKTVQKLNSVLDDTRIVSKNIADSSNFLGQTSRKIIPSLVSAVSMLGLIGTWFKNLRSSKEDFDGNEDK